MASTFTKKRIVVLIVVVACLLAGMAVAFAYSTWSTVNRVTIDRTPEGEPTPAAQGEPVEEGETDPVEADEETEIFLLVGSDARDELDDLQGFGDFEGRRADVVMVLIKSPTGTAILSLPRDLWVEDACTGSENRLNALLEGCGDRINGPTLLLLAVEDLIGEPVDHYAMVDLAGFQEAVDRIGGYEICVELPVRDARANLSLPQGCTAANGAESLAWLRSRHTEELTANGWQIMFGMNDLVRNERQRRFLIDMMARLSDFTSPQSLTIVAGSLAPHVTVDDQLTLTDAVNLAWAMRNLDQGEITELEVQVQDHLTDQGAAVLLPVTPVDEIVAGFLESSTTAGAVGAVAG